MIRLFITAFIYIFLQQATIAQTFKSVDNSLNAGKVEWGVQQYNVGSVPYGKPVTREFEVKNISTENLMLLQVKSSCHCTTASFSKEAVAPGETTKITVTYDSLKEGDFYRIVTVLTNFDAVQSIPLILVGKVMPQEVVLKSN